MSGYEVGPTLAPGEAPWCSWESDPRIDDGHQHRWECVLLAPSLGHRLEEVVRCKVCHAPRCGHSMDEDPCMLRRHHLRWHLYLSGRTEAML
jgi:hypothetical protein